MSIKPGLYNKKYNPSDVQVKGFEFVEDFASENGNVIYFLCMPLERGVALKAYINSYKLNLVKAVDFETSTDSNTQIPKEYGMDLSFDVSLDIPAGSMEEARNNFAKIAELQKLLAPLESGHRAGMAYGTSPRFDSKVPYFSVWFKNLISSGVQFGSYPEPSSVTVKDMFNYGFICLIEEIRYEPDMEAGFFEHDTLLLPKNITLNLNLKYAIEIEGISSAMLKSGLMRPSIPFLSFLANGHYDPSDRGGFPFGIGVVSDNKAAETAKASLLKKEYTTSSINKIDTSLENGYNPTTIFISMHNKKNNKIRSSKNAGTDSDNIRIRYVQFKAFINSFDRNVKLAYTENTNKARSIGQTIANLGTASTLDELVYNISFEIPSYDLNDAKKNCGKIQYLTRMFAKSGDSDRVAQSEGQQRKHNKLNKRDLKVYIPNFIESSKSWGKFGSFNTMFKSALDLVITSISIDVDNEAGYYEEQSSRGLPYRLFPKSMKITMSLKHTSPASVIKNYMYIPPELGGGYYTVGSKSKEEHLFPFRRPHTYIRKK